MTLDSAVVVAHNGAMMQNYHGHVSYSSAVCVWSLNLDKLSKTLSYYPGTFVVGLNECLSVSEKKESSSAICFTFWLWESSEVLVHYSSSFGCSELYKLSGQVTSLDLSGYKTGIWSLYTCVA